MKTPDVLSERIVRPAELCERLALSRPTIWRMTRRGDLPAPIRISPGAVGWKESTINAWIDEREADATGGR